MEKVTFIHTADLHLDAPLSSLGDEDKANTRNSEIFKCLENICQRVINQDINILIISGDFFESKNVKGSTILSAKNLFSELYKTEIVICPGNHDPFIDNSYYSVTKWGSNVHILNDTKKVLFLEKYNTCIYNIGSTGNVKDDYQTLLNCQIQNDKFNLLLFHGTVDMPFEDDNYNPISSKELFSLGMDYIALGHMHCYSYSSDNNKVIINPGSPEPLGFDEEGVHGFIQGEITLSDKNNKSINTEFLPSATRHYHNLEVHISDCKNDEDVIKKIYLETQNSILSTDLYSICLRGFIAKNYSLDIKNILDSFDNKCFYIRLKNQTSIEYDYDMYLDDPGIKGEFVRRIIGIIDSETSTKRKETLFMALQYGLQALENGRIE